MKTRLNHVCVNEGSSKYSSFITARLCLHCIFGTKMVWALYLSLSPAHTFKDFCLGYFSVVRVLKGLVGPESKVCWSVFAR